jgi:hypothetical protein
MSSDTDYKDLTRDELIESLEKLEKLCLETLKKRLTLLQAHKNLQQQNKNLTREISDAKVEAWQLKNQITLLKRQLATLRNPDCVETPVVTPRMPACHNPYIIRT